MPYTDEQKKVAKALLAGPRPAAELAKELGLAEKAVEEALAGMVKLGVVHHSGTPPRYSLAGIVVKGVNRRMAAKGEKPFRVKMLIEGLSQSEDALKKEMGVLEERLRKEPYDITAFKRSDVANQDKNFTMFFDAEVAVPKLKDVTYLIISYGPSYVELLEPKRVELSLAETQDVLNEVMSAVHYYVGFITQLKHEQLARVDQK